MIETEEGGEEREREKERKKGEMMGPALFLYAF